MAEPTDTAASNDPSDTSAQRRRGLARMGEVYSFEVSDGPGDFFGYTVEHLFGDIWEREGLSLRDRRLLLIGLMVAEGLDGTLGIQLDSSLVKGDLTADDLFAEGLTLPSGSALPEPQISTVLGAIGEIVSARIGA